MAGVVEMEDMTGVEVVMTGMEDMTGMEVVMTEMEVVMTEMEVVMTEMEDGIKKEKRASRQHRSMKLNLDCLTEVAR
jgi:glucose/arabinose dehydrogenase